MVQKALLDVVQAILEQADSLPAMSQSLYRTNVFVYKDTDEIAPDYAIMMMENRLDIRSRSLALPHDLEVLPYSDVIVDAHGIEVFQPLTSDELPVGLYKFYPLLGVGIAPLVHHLEDDWECHSFVNDAQDEDVYGRMAQTPVSALK